MLQKLMTVRDGRLFWKYRSRIYVDEKYKPALKMFAWAFAIAKKIGNRNIQCNILNNSAIIYDELGKIDSAIIYIKKSRKSAIGLNAYEVICKADHNLASYYMKCKEYDSAFFYATNSLNLAKKIGLRN